MDHSGDMTGLFESGIDGLVSLHHMLHLWKPFPDEHTNKLNDTMYLLQAAYTIFSDKFLKRYVRIKYNTNQTLLLTLGYSFSVFNRILSFAELTQIEKTWCCTEMVERKTRPKENNKTTWYFGGLANENINGSIKHTVVYENKKDTFDQIPKIKITIMN